LKSISFLNNDYAKAKAIGLSLMLLCSFVFVFFQYTSTVEAEDITWTRHVIDSSFPYAINTACGDIDQDGYNDIIAVSRLGSPCTISWYKSNPSYTSWTQYVVYTVSGNRMVDVDDMDGDGDLDIIVTNYDQDRLDVFECPADPTDTPWTRHVVTTSHVDPGYLMWLADFDGDNDTDIYASSPYDSELVWFRNDGGFSFTTYTLANLAGARGIAIGDFDNDGDMDVTGATGSSSLYWYENKIDSGQNTGWDSTLIKSGTLNAPTGQCATDVDGDGDTDVVVKNYDDTGLYWFENDNDGTSWTMHTISISYTAKTYDIYADDLDGDGDGDVVVGRMAGGSGIFWAENTDGAGTSWSGHLITAFGNETRDVFIYDVDDDGALDVLAADLPDNSIWWFESNLSGDGGDESDPVDTNTSFNLINNMSNNSATSEQLYLFNWSVVDNASYYNLQLANDSGFSDVFLDLSLINESNYGVNYSEAGDDVEFILPSVYRKDWYGDYYCRVRAVTYVV